ncbi:sigma-70 family RNA polymerase sigma factor [Labedella phragmitis]|uniref:Sigma-70 family RNA polymerase sigma factor n=1 Tax=Labedella phragmitis TaxID=2498849 RepID=A0A444PVU3_9MICO|nr:sigma-70 family RNA polymerase sigma factor [Labedella phragmitis]RWZ51996.1 sigma-70 family RNA polymerase sigma factor [Labedella phragmitis]
MYSPTLIAVRSAQVSWVAAPSEALAPSAPLSSLGASATFTRTTGRSDVSNDLVHAHLALAEALAERWSGRGSDRLDLRQVAYLALVKASRRFDRQAGSAFAAFAAAYIRGELLHYLRDSARIVRIPRAFVGTGDTSAGSLAAPLSLDAAVVTADDVVPLSSTVGDFDRRLDEADSRIPLVQALRTLPDDARLVVYLRYFEDLTQAEIARRTGSTQKAVSRSLDGSLRALRRELDRPHQHREAQGTVHR